MNIRGEPTAIETEVVERFQRLLERHWPFIDILPIR